MNTGNNVPYNQWKQVIDHPVKRKALIEYLLPLPSTEKVMRYPDGGETLFQGYDLTFLDKFIEFCREAGVESVVLRGDFSDMNQTVTVYEILQSNLNVLYVEASNEPFYSPWDDPKGWREILTKMFNKTAYFKLKANQYADKVLQLKKVFEGRGINLRHKYAFACPVPHNHKLRTWYSVLWQRLSGRVMTGAVHLYCSDPQDPNWLRDNEEILISIDFDLICTEFNGIHFGKHGNTNHADLAFTERHRLLNNGLLRIFKRLGFNVALQHTMFHTFEDRLFGRLIVKDDGMIYDRMPVEDGWEHK